MSLFRAIAIVDNDLGQPRHRASSKSVVLIVPLDANAAQPERRGGRNRRAGAHNWVENYAFAERQCCTNKLPHERLKFERRVRSDPAFDPASRSGIQQVLERFLG